MRTRPDNHSNSRRGHYYRQRIHRRRIGKKQRGMQLRCGLFTYDVLCALAVTYGFIWGSLIWMQMVFQFIDHWANTAPPPPPQKTLKEMVSEMAQKTAMAYFAKIQEEEQLQRHIEQAAISAGRNN